MTNWYQIDAATTTAQLKTDPKSGLPDAEAQERLTIHGPNTLIEQGLKSPWRILWEQLSETMVVILIVAAILSAVLGDYEDAIVILAIVILNAALGFRQEYKAEQAMAALKQLAVPTVKVRREGHVREISARELVPGDVVLLETGNLVPADGRILDSINLRIEEAALTGESEAVEKNAKALFETEQALGDRLNMVYMGTIITYGHGEAVITDTGMDTELGRIATLIQTVTQEATPLQKRLAKLGQTLAIVALAIVAIIFTLGLLRGEAIRTMFLTAVSLAVAAVPEGMPAVVTIALALGSQRMLKRQALIRKLPAVETLGSVTVICSDKTGTLTQNKMTVTVLDVAGQRVDLKQTQMGGALEVKTVADEPIELDRHPALALLLAGGALCNDAILETDDGPGQTYLAVGDPTEGALVVAAAQMGLQKPHLEQAMPRIDEVPFDSTRKRMTTVHQFSTQDSKVPAILHHIWPKAMQADEAQTIAFTKGAFDRLLDVSTQAWVEGQAERMTDTFRARLTTAHDQLAQNGMRVLGVAFQMIPPQSEARIGEDFERDLTFVGLVGMIDPPRPEVKMAVQTCQAAGIRPIMITGDHPLTARHIAAQLGITTDDQCLTGQDVDRLTPSELDTAVDRVAVFARVSPEHKLNLVQVLQQKGHVVAMTGDGVNDAPALKQADIGIAMGITGTDVSKEAADMILRDDNFASIVAAVEEGRVIYDNIRKFIKYLLSCNSGEIWVMLLGPFLGMPLPLLPLQILWMNLVTDGLPALALGIEPAEHNVMQRPPHAPSESLFSRGMGRDIIWTGLVMGVASLAVGYGYWIAGQANWQTMVFTVLTLSQMALALSTRSEQHPFFQIGFFTNKAMVGAVSLTFLLQLVVIYVPFMQDLFETMALSGLDLLLAIVVSTVIFWIVEGVKWLKKRRQGLELQLNQT